MSLLTDEFRHVLPFALYSASPKLSALHTTRRKILALKSRIPDSNIPSTLCCPRCGILQLTSRRTFRDAENPLNKPVTSRFSGDLKNSSQSIVGAVTCTNCLATPSHQLISAARRSMPMVRHMRKQRNRTISSETDSPSPETPVATIANKLEPGIMNTNPPTVPVTQITKRTGGSTGKSRLKKRVGLQEMLVRSRSQREKNAAEAHHAGLADFLVGL